MEDRGPWYEENKKPFKAWEKQHKEDKEKLRHVIAARKKARLEQLALE